MVNHFHLIFGVYHFPQLGGVGMGRIVYFAGNQLQRSTSIEHISPANADHGLGSRGGPADHMTGSLLTN